MRRFYDTCNRRKIQMEVIRAFEHRFTLNLSLKSSLEYVAALNLRYSEEKKWNIYSTNVVYSSFKSVWAFDMAELMSAITSKTATTIKIAVSVNFKNKCTFFCNSSISSIVLRNNFFDYFRITLDLKRFKLKNIN